MFQDCKNMDVLALSNSIAKTSDLCYMHLVYSIGNRGRDYSMIELSISKYQNWEI